jgi:hypothetical protein
MVIVPAPDVILLAKVNDDGGEMGRQIVADEDLDLIFWQKPMYGRNTCRSIILLFWIMTSS